MKTTDDNGWHLPPWGWEVLVSFLKAIGVTFTLWVKRLVERAIGRKWLDGPIFQRGLVPPTNGTTGNGSNASWSSSGNGQPLRTQYGGSSYGEEGPGVQWVYSARRNERFRVAYEAVYRDLDGVKLYKHDVMLNDGHAWNCPLLKVDTPCISCEWYVSRRGQNGSDSMCASVYKLEMCPRDRFETVRLVRSQLEQS
jgi:hypothetical protein